MGVIIWDSDAAADLTAVKPASEDTETARAADTTAIGISAAAAPALIKDADVVFRGSAFAAPAGAIHAGVCFSAFL